MSKQGSRQRARVSRSDKKSGSCRPRSRRANSVCLECTAHRSVDNLFNLSGSEHSSKSEDGAGEESGGDLLFRKTKRDQINGIKLVSKGKKQTSEGAATPQPQPESIKVGVKESRRREKK